jgi:hypothetical protein
LKGGVLPMSRTITIDPVTSLKGHGKMPIYLNDQGEVEKATFHVTQVRGFERFAEGRPFYEMPNLMARICGICPVSHLIASARACESIMSVRIPYSSAQLRRMLNLAQMAQSHALSFFYLSSPDLPLGMTSDPATRNIFGAVNARPGLGRAGVSLRRFGQHIIELLWQKAYSSGLARRRDAYADISRLNARRQQYSLHPCEANKAEMQGIAPVKMLVTVRIVRFALATKIIGDAEPFVESLKKPYERAVSRWLLAVARVIKTFE